MSTTDEPATDLAAEALASGYYPEPYGLLLNAWSAPPIDFTNPDAYDLSRFGEPRFGEPRFGEPRFGEPRDGSLGVGGLPSAVAAGLSLSPSGFPLFASDTGGYRDSPPSKETFTRWFEHAAL